METVGIIIDIALVAILVIFGLIGYKKGLLRSVLSLFSWVVCLSVAIFVAKYVAQWLNGIYNFSGLIGNKIAQSLIKSNEFFAQSINVYEAGGKDALISAIPTNNKLLAQLIKIIFSNSNVDMTSTDTIGSVVGASSGHICMIIISGVLVFLVLMLAVGLLSKLFKKIEQTKILGGLNKFLGLILGLIKGALIVVVINCILVAVTMIPAANKVITPAVKDNTYVEKAVYNTTDKLFEKYVIEGKAVQHWLDKLWESR